MVDVSDVVPVKSTVEILQNFVAFSECMNFKYQDYFYQQIFSNKESDMQTCLFKFPKDYFSCPVTDVVKRKKKKSLPAL